MQQKAIYNRKYSLNRATVLDSLLKDNREFQREDICLVQYFQNYPYLKLHKILVTSIVKYIVREVFWDVTPCSLIHGC